VRARYTCVPVYATQAGGRVRTRGCVDLDVSNRLTRSFVNVDTFDEKNYLISSLRFLGIINTLDIINTFCVSFVNIVIN